MADNVLITTKKMLGLSEDDTSFDVDVLLSINSAMSNLTQLGVNSIAGIEITDSTTYDDITSNITIRNYAKSYLYLKTRLLFDPPSSSFVLESIKAQVAELEWRICTWQEIHGGD